MPEHQQPNWFEIPPPPSEGVNPPEGPDPTIIMGPTRPPEGDAALNRTEPLPVVPADAAATQPSEPEKMKLRERVGAYLGIAYHGLRATINEQRQQWAEDAELVSEADAEFYEDLGRVATAHLNGDRDAKLEVAPATDKQKAAALATVHEVRKPPFLAFERHRADKQASFEVARRNRLKPHPLNAVLSPDDAREATRTTRDRVRDRVSDPAKPKKLTRAWLSNLSRRENWADDVLPTLGEVPAGQARRAGARATKRADALHEASQAHRERQEELKQKLKK